MHGLAHLTQCDDEQPPTNVEVVVGPWCGSSAKRRERCMLVFSELKSAPSAFAPLTCVEFVSLGSFI